MLITNAVVLSRNDYRDSDRMVTLLSPTLGRVDAAARGCKKPKSPLMNATELFCAGEFSLVETRGRYTMTQCQISESFYALRSDCERLTAGVYLLQLAKQASLPGEPCERLFLTLLKALAFLSYGNLPPPLVVMAFELHDLSILGMAPQTALCVRCGKPLEDSEDARFDARLGGTCCPNCPAEGKKISYGARRIMMRVPVTRFDVIDRLLERREWPEAARHTREFIANLLDTPPRIWPELPAPR